MPVAVYQSNKRGTGLEAIAQGLQIANTVYGIKTNMEQLEKLKNDEGYVKQTREDKASGVYSTEDVDKLGIRVPEGTPGARMVKERQGANVGSVAIMPPKKESDGPSYSPFDYVDENGVTKRGYSDNKTRQEFRTPNDTIVKKPEVAKVDYTRQDRSDKVTSELRNEYEKHDTTKQTRSIVEGVNRLDGAIATPNLTPQDGMAIVYGFMKTLDPGARLTDNDYATAKNTKDVPDAILNAYNTFKDGDILTDKQAARFVETARRLMQAQLKTQEPIDARYAQISKKYGVDQAFVIDDQFGTLRKSFGENPYSENKKPPAQASKPLPTPVGLKAPTATPPEPKPQPMPVPQTQQAKRREWVPNATAGKR